jgi:hypothetical protein
MRDAHKSGLVLRLLRNPDEVMPVWEKLDPPCRPWNASALRYLHDTVILRSPRLKKLFNGILQVNTEYRWGPRQVRNWLDKEEILTSDNKKLWREERYPGKEIPYPRKMFGTLVKKPDHLAALVDDPAFRDTIYSDLGNTLLNWASMFSGELKDRLEALCQDHGSEKDLALFKLQFILDPSLPLVIGLKSINTFDDFSRRILEADDEQSLIALEEGLWKEKFEGWIDAVCGNKLNVSTNKNGTKEILSFLKRLRAGTNRNRRLAVWELRWYFFSKTIPFPFMNKRAETPQALVKMIDRDESSRKEGIRLMNEGWIGAWLFYRFGDDSPEFRDQNNLVAGKNSDRAKLEALLHILDVDLEWALPEAKPEKFNFGKIAYDSNKSVNIRFQNKLRGYWESDILLRPKSSRGFELSLSTVTQGDLVTLTARPGSLPVGKSHRAKVVVSYFFGKERTELCVPVSFRVAAPVWKMAGRSFLIAVVFGAILGGLRYCMNYAHELNAFQTLNWMPWSAVANLNWKVMKHIGGIEWVLIGIALLFAGTIGYGFIRLRAQSQIRR